MVLCVHVEELEGTEGTVGTWWWWCVDSLGRAHNGVFSAMHGAGLWKSTRVKGT